MRAVVADAEGSVTRDGGARTGGRSSSPGLEHPNFVAIVEELTAGGADKLGQAAAALSA